MLARADGRVWVGERIGTPGAWQMPQGGIDEGEDPVEAGLRELEEETGVPKTLVTVEAVTSDWVTYDLPAELVGKLWNGRFRGQKQKWLLLRFHGRDRDIDIATAHPEFASWEWCDSNQLIARIVPFKRGVYEQVLAEFGDRL